MRILACISASLLTVSAAIAAPQKPTGRTDAAVAQSIIKKRLLDPYSVRFEMRPLVTGKDTEGKAVKLTCGTYNAKNRMGGYVGAKHFVYVPTERAVFTSEIEQLGEDGQDVTADALSENKTDIAALHAAMAQVEALSGKVKFWLLQCA